MIGKSYKYDDDAFVRQLEEGSALLQIIGFKDIACPNTDLLISILHRAKVHVIVCSSNSAENVIAFGKDNNLLYTDDDLRRFESDAVKSNNQKSQNPNERKSRHMVRFERKA